MSPIKREREYERRRYEKWRDKQAEKQALRLRRRRILSVGAAALALVVTVVGVGFLVASRSDDGTDLAIDPALTPSPSTSAPADNPCPVPTSTPVAEPPQWTEAPPASDAEGKTFALTLTTSCGPVVIALDGTKAPQAVSSTIFLAQNAFYDATRCHRLTTEGIYVLQCGDPTRTGTGSPGYSYGPVENAPADDLYPAGTVAMARQGGAGDSMGSQFFLVYQDSVIPSDAAGGYTVLGTITSGLEIVEQIAAGGATGGGSDGAPNWEISIESATVEEG